MRVVMFIFFIVTFLNAPFAQNNSYGERFEKVDRHVVKVSREFIFHPQLLVEKLTENMNNDYDKVRAIYVWIAYNTEYDLLAFYLHKHDQQGIYDVLANGKALCLGFSLLFEYLCKQAGIDAVIIEGYAKGFGFNKNQQFKETNHAWNAVFIHGSWYLLDVTWATGDPHRIPKHKNGIDLNTYFLTSPEKFILKHLPEDPSWQLLENKISMIEFEKNKGESFRVEPKFYNTFSPQDYLNLNLYDSDVKRYKRAVNFNPRNNILKERLSFAYLYKGISMTDEIESIDFITSFDTVKVLCNDFYSFLDSAWITIAHLDNWKIPKIKTIMLDELNYQKGVFNYEMGKELYIKGMQSDKFSVRIDEKVEALFKEAEEHFKNVPSTSIYLKDANEYLAFISDFHAQSQTSQLSTN